MINCFGALLNEGVPDVSEIKSGSQKRHRGNANLCHVDMGGLFFALSSNPGTISLPVKRDIFPTTRWCGGRRKKEAAVTPGGLCCWVNYGAALLTTKDAVGL